MGCIATLRNGVRAYIIPIGENRVAIVGHQGYVYVNLTENGHLDMDCHELSEGEYAVEEIERIDHDDPDGLRNPLFGNGYTILEWLNYQNHRKILWQRYPEKEMTQEEIEKVLGYRIKITKLREGR